MKNYVQKDTAAPYDWRLLPCSRGGAVKPILALKFQNTTLKCQRIEQ